MSDEFRTPYRGYDVLDKWNTPSWNDVTREVVARRLNEVPVRQFLDAHAYATVEAICERLIPQPDRADPVPIAPFIDEKLHRCRTDGYRYDGMPPLREAWRLGLRGIDDEAHLRFGPDFVALPDSHKDEILAALRSGEVRSEAWQQVNPAKFFGDHLLYTAVSIYYAHPWAWNEIGFGGPASPRGYARLQADVADPWEAPIPPREVRRDG